MNCWEFPLALPVDFNHLDDAFIPTCMGNTFANILLRFLALFCTVFCACALSALSGVRVLSLSIARSSVPGWPRSLRSRGWQGITPWRVADTMQWLGKNALEHRLRGKHEIPQICGAGNRKADRRRLAYFRTPLLSPVLASIRCRS